VTACFKLIRAMQNPSRLKDDTHCRQCVYFTKNLDEKEYPLLMTREDRCGLGFLPGDASCSEMRTENCSIRKGKS